MTREVKRDEETQRGGRRAPPREFCELLRKLRISRGFSQSELARRIGSSPSYVCRIEGAQRLPSPQLMLKIARALDCEYERLLVASGLLDSEGVPGKPRRPSIREEVEELKRTVSALVGYDRYLPRTDEAAAARRAIPVLEGSTAGVSADACVFVDAEAKQMVLAEDELDYDSEAFALKVTGDSMVSAGILDGDILVVSPSAPVKSGDIAVVMLGDQGLSVKTVEFQDGRLLLRPANLRYPPAALEHPDGVEILGKVVLLRRWLG